MMEDSKCPKINFNVPSKCNPEWEKYRDNFEMHMVNLDVFNLVTDSYSHQDQVIQQYVREVDKFLVQEIGRIADQNPEANHFYFWIEYGNPTSPMTVTINPLIPEKIGDRWAITPPAGVMEITTVDLRKVREFINDGTIKRTW